MRRFFVKNLLFLITVNLLVKPVWVLLIDRTVQNKVGHASYGTYQALLSVAIIFQILLDFGLVYYNTRILAQDPKRIKDIFPAMLSTRLLFIIGYLLAGFTAGWMLGYRGWELSLLGGVLLIQSFNSLLLFIRSNVSALHKFKADSVLSVIDRLLMIILCGSLLLYPVTAERFGIEWFVGAQIVCYAIAIAIAFTVLRKISGITFRLNIDTTEIRKIIRESLPYATLVFMMAIHMRCDTILVERIAGKEQAGIYAAGYRLLDVGNNMFGLMFAGILLPLFGRMLSQKENTAPIVRVSVNILLPFSFVVAIIAACYGTEIMTALYHDAGSYEGDVFGWLMGAFPAFSMMYIFSTLLTANGNLKLLNYVAVAGVLVNITLNLLLIRQNLALGAAIATCITQSFLAVCYITLSAKKLKLAIDSKWLAAHAGFIFLSAASGYGLMQLDMNWIFSLLLTAALCVGYMFLFRFVSVTAIKQLASNKTSA
ncbi:MAG: hypothetical protein EOP56_17715 [Sphingobacteriales bacterium]|nr:MAG: hypothetical protein EOP56_17715 [Sphingobacteriales bacterium]